MNILILSWRGPKHPNAGGAEISTHEHAKGWVKAGHKVTLFTSAFVKCKEEENIDGVYIIRKGRQFIGVQWEAFKWYLFGNHPKFDLVVDQFHGIPFFTPLYVKTKKLAFIHEVTKEVWWLNPWPWPFNKITAFFGEMIEPLLFVLYRKIVFMTVSQSTKNDLIAWGIPKKRITIIHNGIKTWNFTKLPKREKKKSLVYLGSLSKDKGIETALKIFAYINKREPDWQFWIIGFSDSRYLEYLKNESNKLGINDKIQFFGFVSEKNKFTLLAKSYILVHPSIREGWGLVVLEAAAVGTPTAAFKVSGLCDSIVGNQTGIICSTGTIDCLGNDICKLLTNNRRYIQISDAAKSWSKKFSWNKSTSLSLKLIEDITR